MCSILLCYKYKGPANRVELNNDVLFPNTNMLASSSSFCRDSYDDQTNHAKPKLPSPIYPVKFIRGKEMANEWYTVGHYLFTRYLLVVSLHGVPVPGLGTPHYTYRRKRNMGYSLVTTGQMRIYYLFKCLDRWLQVLAKT